MHFSTPVDTDSEGFRLELDQHIMMMGSCFTESIGSRLKENQWSACINPFGVLYNPMSIFHALELLLQSVSKSYHIVADDLFSDNDIYYHWAFSSDYAAVSSDEALVKMNRSIDAAVKQLKRLDVLFLTFGTNRYYRLKSSGEIVANCHKQPHHIFTEERAGVDEIVEAWMPTAMRLFDLRPSLKVILTVSPYRYVKYGLHGNSLGKAVLLLSVDKIITMKTSHKDHYRYFPAYEILNDELRDYRFYSSDMLHPSTQAIDFIWYKLRRDWMTEEANCFITEWQPLLQGFHHLPMFPESETYNDFIKQLNVRKNKLCEKYNVKFNSDFYK